MCSNFVLRVLIALAALRAQVGIDAGDIGDYIAEVWPMCAGTGATSYHTLYAQVSAVLAALGGF